MSIIGYASSTSVSSGGSIDFHLSSDSPGLTNLTIERVGTTSVSVTITATLANLSTLATNPWEGFGWPVAVSFSVPSTWPTGLYRLRVGTTAVLWFVVRPAVPGATSKVLLQIPFLTYAAYNDAGGKSLYGFNSGGEANRASKVSFDRPFYNGYGPQTNGAEETLIRWLENEGIPVECCSTDDLHSNSMLLAAYDCLVLVGHDEYWTKPMRDQAERFVANGGNMIVLSGNTCYRAVRLEQSNRLVVFHKYAGSDPSPIGEEVTVAWAEPPINRPQNILLGAGFTEGAFGGPSTAYTIRFPSHWVFGGLASPPATSAFMHYETDAAAFVDESEGYPRVTGEEGTPLSFTVLASADLRDWSGKPGRATMGIYSRNGTVFNAATTDWLGANALGSDPIITQVTRNVFARLKQRVLWDWEHIGHANFGCALTSLGGKLYIATKENRLWRRYPVGADVVWRDIGHANDVVAMAGSGDTLFCVTGDNRLWWRTPVEIETNWTEIGTGPYGGTKALAAAGGMLYAADSSGALWRTPASRATPVWSEMIFGRDSTVNAMTSYSDILFATTEDNRLLRSNRDWINESSGWERIHHCNFSVGIAVVEWMLFVATTEDRLWRIDLYSLRQP